MMQRRTFLKGLALFPFLPRFVASAFVDAARSLSRVRPGEPGWPDPAEWARLRRAVGGRLVSVESPFVECANAPAGASCSELFESLGNPFFIGDSVARRRWGGPQRGRRRPANTPSWLAAART
jgi:hypothetical protein